MPETEFEQPRYCWRCGRPVVVAQAEFCKDCGAALAGSRLLAPNPGFKPSVAAFLSIIPGLGHVYKGRPARGALWFFCVAFAYTFQPPLGLLLHLVCAANAALKGALNDRAIARIPRRFRAGLPPLSRGGPP